MRMMHSYTLATMPFEPMAEKADEIEELAGVYFANFQAASTTNMDALTNFRADRKESLYMLKASLISSTFPSRGTLSFKSRSLAMAIILHLQDMGRSQIVSEMWRQRKAREKWGQPFIYREELTTMGREEEAPGLTLFLGS